MPSAIDRVRAHFDALGTRKIEVPEWGLAVYSSPVTIEERKRIYRNEAEADSFAICVEILLVKAKDADGKPLFQLEDKAPLLRHADSAVVVRVAAAIMASDAPDVAELKN
jgi:hypothetical protein